MANSLPKKGKCTYPTARCEIFQFFGTGPTQQGVGPVKKNHPVDFAADVETPVAAHAEASLHAVPCLTNHSGWFGLVKRCIWFGLAWLGLPVKVGQVEGELEDWTAHYHQVAHLNTYFV